MDSDAITSGSKQLSYDEKCAMLTHDMRVSIANMLIRDTLPHANAICDPVHPKQSFYTKYGKRVLDIVLSTLALVVTSPINLVLAICTFFDVGRPIAFNTNRPGKDGELFTLLKLRNMTNAVDENGNLLPADQRVTKFGQFVRRTSLDELLNFWSIFKGDMSVIGPRPLVSEYVPRFSTRHAYRMAVRPGLECPMKDNIDHAATYDEQFENDVWYVENCSLTVDLKLAYNLVRLTLSREATRRRGEASRGCFIGYDSEGKAISIKQVDESYFDKVLVANSEEGPI